MQRKMLNAKAFRAHRGLRIMFAGWHLCDLRRLRLALLFYESPYLFISVVKISALRRQGLSCRGRQSGCGRYYLVGAYYK